MRPFVLLSLVIIVLLAAVPATADCRYEDQRQAVGDAAGARVIVIDVGAGSLEIEGQPGSSIRAEGTVCASSTKLRDGVDLRIERQGDRVIVRTIHPNRGVFNLGNTYARLDLTLEVPDDIPLEIEDSSGSITIIDVAALEIEDSSGSIEARNVLGPVSIDDSSGSIDLRQVGGSVRVWDSSGSITIDGVEGSVVIEDDSSGSIDVRGVTDDVYVRHDSSGSINVSDVGGDFTVKRDGSGGIRYRNVSGSVDLPRSW